MTPKDNFIHICNLTTSVMGLRKGSLAFKTRKQEIQIPRMVAAVIGRIEEHISHSVIGEVLSRHRASIYHYEKCHQGNYTWEKYREVFNKVYMTYKQIEQSKKVFVDRYYMKEYLLKNGVKENAKNEVNIMLKSGRIGVVITTSYMDFSNQLENIKFALRDYKYEMEIL
jgi:site-specific DNA-adenine methylase